MDFYAGLLNAGASGFCVAIYANYGSLLTLAFSVICGILGVAFLVSGILKGVK